MPPSQSDQPPGQQPGKQPDPEAEVPAHVIVLAGPSGAGKSRLAERLGLPTLRLDDFYRDGDDARLPRIASGPNAGLVDWDHPDSWLREDAMSAIRELAATGRAQVPIYELSQDGRCGWRELDLGGAPFFAAEGLFADGVVEQCRREHLLAAAYCIRQHRLVTFWRRLVRDLREHRKPPLVLLRRGLALMAAQGRIVDRAVAAGCTPLTGDEAYPRLRAFVESPGLRRQPSGTTCGPSVLVAARAVLEPDYDRWLRVGDRFAEEVLRAHRRLGPRPGNRTANGVPLGMPWPRALGTWPGHLARELGTLSGTRYRVHRVRRPDPASYERVLAAVRAGRPAALYVGSRLLPRHVVLVQAVYGDDLSVYDPASGRTVTVRRTDWTSGRLGLAGWDRPWFVLA